METTKQIKIDRITEHDLIVEYIANSFKDKFKVLTNINNPQHYIASIFPDIILQDKDARLRFIIEVKNKGGVAQCIQTWKSVPVIPSTLYIIVPKDMLAEAKKISEIVGLSTKFGCYTIDETGENITVWYE